MHFEPFLKVRKEDFETVPTLCYAQDTIPFCGHHVPDGWIDVHLDIVGTNTAKVACTPTWARLLPRFLRFISVSICTSRAAMIVSCHFFLPIPLRSSSWAMFSGSRKKCTVVLYVVKRCAFERNARANCVFIARKMPKQRSKLTTTLQRHESSKTNKTNERPRFGKKKNDQLVTRANHVRQKLQNIPKSYIAAFTTSWWTTFCNSPEDTGA